MHEANCASCQLSIDADDNFCRNCGTPAVEASLPAARTDATITIWRPHASPVVKGAAVMAAGTIGQFLVRRAFSTLMSGSGRKRARTLSIRRDRADDGMLDEAQIITETVMMRRVRVRRLA